MLKSLQIHRSLKDTNTVQCTIHCILRVPWSFPLVVLVVSVVTVVTVTLVTVTVAIVRDTTSGYVRVLRSTCF